MPRPDQSAQKVGVLQVRSEETETASQCLYLKRVERTGSRAQRSTAVLNGVLIQDDAVLLVVSQIHGHNWLHE